MFFLLSNEMSGKGGERVYFKINSLYWIFIALVLLIIRYAIVYNMTMRYHHISKDV
ncbi:putative membrane protein [Citrobacter rodentium ICC168]|uniref:Membrane protein n=1 Tax=Citrobacter rodentium (strain ICC168) TaxID=637910 RepID=D2TI16_CITRI|nr:putative membrane protein [Citrobacter rodentium ICC168]